MRVFVDLSCGCDVFFGWFMDFEFNVLFCFEGVIMFVSNFVLYVKWFMDLYIVEFYDYLFLLDLIGNLM